MKRLCGINNVVLKNIRHYLTWEYLNYCIYYVHQNVSKKKIRLLNFKSFLQEVILGDGRWIVQENCEFCGLTSLLEMLLEPENIQPRPLAENLQFLARKFSKLMNYKPELIPTLLHCLCHLIEMYSVDQNEASYAIAHVQHYEKWPDVIGDLKFQLIASRKNCRCEDVPLKSKVVHLILTVASNLPVPHLVKVLQGSSLPETSEIHQKQINVTAEDDTGAYDFNSVKYKCLAVDNTELQNEMNGSIKAKDQTSYQNGNAHSLTEMQNIANNPQSNNINPLSIPGVCFRRKRFKKYPKYYYKNVFAVPRECEKDVLQMRSPAVKKQKKTRPAKEKKCFAESKFVSSTAYGFRVASAQDLDKHNRQMKRFADRYKKRKLEKAAEKKRHKLEMNKLLAKRGRAAATLQVEVQSSVPTLFVKPAPKNYPCYSVPSLENECRNSTTVKDNATQNYYIERKVWRLAASDTKLVKQKPETKESSETKLVKQKCPVIKSEESKAEGDLLDVLSDSDSELIDLLCHSDEKLGESLSGLKSVSKDLFKGSSDDSTLVDISRSSIPNRILSRDSKQVLTKDTAVVSGNGYCAVTLSDLKSVSKGMVSGATNHSTLVDISNSSKPTKACFQGTKQVKKKVPVVLVDTDNHNESKSRDLKSSLGDKETSFETEFGNQLNVENGYSSFINISTSSKLSKIFDENGKQSKKMDDVNPSHSDVRDDNASFTNNSTSSKLSKVFVENGTRSKKLNDVNHPYPSDVRDYNSLFTNNSTISEPFKLFSQDIMQSEKKLDDTICIVISDDECDLKSDQNGSQDLEEMEDNSLLDVKHDHLISSSQGKPLSRRKKDVIKVTMDDAGWIDPEKWNMTKIRRKKVGRKDDSLKQRAKCFTKEKEAVNDRRRVGVRALQLTEIDPKKSADDDDFDEMFLKSSLQIKKERRPWTKKEEETLFRGVKKFGEGKWEEIGIYCNLDNRTSRQIRDKWKYIKAAHHLEEIEERIRIKDGSAR